MSQAFVDFEDVETSRMIEGRGTQEAHWLARPEIATMRSISHDELDRWANRYRHIWVVSPHPDDEILAVGGLMAQLSDAGARLAIVSVTDGTASHPGSSHWTPDRLAVTRPEELRRALNAMGVAAELHRAGLPDGEVALRRADLTAFLSANFDADDLVLVPWRLDGHPDHEATALATMQSAGDVDATVVEYPVWMWHWAAGNERTIPWERARRIPLDASIVARKERAIEQFVSQITPDERSEAVLPAHVLSRFMRPFEVVFC